jgi:hypothetical protein
MAAPEITMQSAYPQSWWGPCIFPCYASIAFAEPPRLAERVT